MCLRKIPCSPCESPSSKQTDRPDSIWRNESGNVFSIVCCGSTRPTIKACGA